MSSKMVIVCIERVFQKGEHQKGEHVGSPRRKQFIEDWMSSKMLIVWIERVFQKGEHQKGEHVGSPLQLLRYSPYPPFPTGQFENKQSTLS